MNIPKPNPGEFAEYAAHYINLVPDDGEIIAYLETTIKNNLVFIRTFPVEKLTQPHAPGEWTIQEILIHMIDVERIFGYRMLRLGRHDPTEMAGFDQDAYVPASGANGRSIDSMLTEYTAVRQATLTLIKSFGEADFLRAGVGSGFQVTVRGLLYHLAGHDLHHIDSIRENYGEESA